MECLMGGGGHDNRRQKVDYFSWNRIPNHQIKEHTKISMLSEERDLAIRERDRALSEKKAAMEERHAAIQQRNAAMAERDTAIRQRDNAIAALRFQERTTNFNALLEAKTKTRNDDEDSVTKLPQKKVKKRSSSSSSKDLNRQVATSHGTKAEWDDVGSMKRIEFDKYTMPVPVCSCTGVPRHCYRWGNGGWQSSCCTTFLSLYPLPQMSNKRHSRVVGRKMSGSVFSRLLTKLVAAGHDSSVALDLKNYWAKHGTNRYVTIK